jgi:hypothetical protein
VREKACAKSTSNNRSHASIVGGVRRFRIGTIHLLHHHIKILMHINPKLDRASAAIKLAAGFLE